MPSTRPNRYRGICRYCGATVKPHAGVCFKPPGARRYAVAHLACHQGKTPSVIEFYSPTSGLSFTQNARGRCIDAPCCGCCS